MFDIIDMFTRKPQSIDTSLLGIGTTRTTTISPYESYQYTYSPQTSENFNYDYNTYSTSYIDESKKLYYAPVIMYSSPYATATPYITSAYYPTQTMTTKKEQSIASQQKQEPTQQNIPKLNLPIDIKQSDILFFAIVLLGGYLAYKLLK